MRGSSDGGFFVKIGEPEMRASAGRARPDETRIPEILTLLFDN